MVINSIDEIVDKTIQHQINLQQFFFLYWVHLGEHRLLEKYCVEGKGFREADVVDLRKRGLVIDYNEKGEYLSDKFFVSNEFTEGFFGDGMKNAQEFYDAYPNFLQIDFSRVTTKGFDPDLFLKQYAIKYGHDDVYHRRIMDALQIAITQGMVNLGLKKWVDSRQWELIEKEFKQKGDERPSDQEF